MGEFINFCAGASDGNLPGNNIDGLLISVAAHCSTEGQLKATIKLKETSKAKKVILDSGGFQVKVAESEGKEIISDETEPIKVDDKVINLAPKHVVDTAIEIKPDALVALDFPIQKVEEEKRDLEFRKKLGFNVTWAIETAELVKKAKSNGELPPELNLFLPIQCFNINQFKRYWQLIKGNAEFQGFSIPARNLSLKETAKFIFEIRKTGKRMIHLLGEGNFKSVAFAAYLSKFSSFDWISLDAKSWFDHAENSTYLSHSDLSSRNLGNNAIIDESIENKCPCPWCKGGKTFTSIKNMPYEEKMQFIGRHNYFVTTKLGRDISDNDKINTIVKLEEHLKKRSNRTDDIKEIVDVLRDIQLYHLNENIIR